MKFILFFTILAVATVPSWQLECELTASKNFVVPIEWTEMNDKCTPILRNQVQEELIAAMTYMKLGAHFSKDTVNRPGFAKFFLESASEERQHAIKILDYMLMRGQLTDREAFGGDENKIKPMINNPKPDASVFPAVEYVNGVAKDMVLTGADALKGALTLETKVTGKIRDIIVACEKPEKDNEYHVVDWLTGEYLEEQYRGQREIAGKLSTLNKLMDDHKVLGEFLFDKKMLNGEV